MASESNSMDFKSAVCQWLQLNEEMTNIQKIVREKKKNTKQPVGHYNELHEKS